MPRVLVAQALKSKSGVTEVYKICEEEGRVKKILISKKPHITEYVNSIQLYGNNNNGKTYQDYFEQDPFTLRQNEVIKTVEKHPKVQKEYSILKDIKITKYITNFLYTLIAPKYKNGKKDFKLIEFFSQISKEDEVRECYSLISTAEPLVNPMSFKDLDINKWDRVNWLQQKRIINI